MNNQLLLVRLIANYSTTQYFINKSPSLLSIVPVENPMKLKLLIYKKKQKKQIPLDQRTLRFRQRFGLFILPFSSLIL